MSALILVAEDDENQAELVRRYLEQDHHRVLVVHDGRDALDVVRIHQPELVVLDLMLPGLGGLDVCRALRTDRDQHDVLVLMLTARSTEDDLLHGLGIGADDYMTKPFSPRELVARVRTLLRRRPAARPAPLLTVGPIVVDPTRHEVTVRGEQVECTPGEFGLLTVLASEVDRVFTREQLLERMHGIDSFFTTRTIDTHVKNLRRKIETTARTPEHLVTVYGIGYKLTAGRRDAP